MNTFTRSDFNYTLPADLIAQTPLSARTDSRLMVLNKIEQRIAHHQFSDIIDFIQPNDILVLNDTKVIPARLLGQKATGGQVECLVERISDQQTVIAQLRASKSPKPGSELIFSNGALSATMLRREGDFFVLRFDVEDILKALEQHGAMPLPPYIDRGATTADQTRYQTVFAEKIGAVAAPTAGLHFDEALLARIRARGVAIETVTLHVGAGTYQPVRVEDLSTHHMHSEWIAVTDKVVEAISSARHSGGRVIAVGTTVVRALETAALSGELLPYTGETDIFITPGTPFHCVDALVTNFHLPESTLLMLVSAFAGYDFMQKAYQAAIAERYRFFSYGDAMLIHSFHN